MSARIISRTQPPSEHSRLSVRATLLSSASQPFFGLRAGATTTGSGNSFFGRLAGGNFTGTGNNNTFIGLNADFDVSFAPGSNNTLLGANAKVDMIGFGQDLSLIKVNGTHTRK